jgi:glucose/arabinose dehydrogenase
MRLQLNNRIHPMGDVIFNPAAKRGDPDWRVLYIGCGDGGSGEQQSAMRSNPQRLDTLVGKVLRIIPDLGEHVDSSSVSENGRYRIPNDNPFVSTEGARKEIWAYGLRNPHRLAWDGGTLLAATVGLHTWETAYIIHKGANYGYPLREGNEALKQDNTTTALPVQDRIPIQVTDKITTGTIVPSYPVLEYPHTADGGDAISGGFVYRGSALPALRGKYIFGDVTTGRIWYADFAELLAADDGKAATLATMHSLRILWNGETYPAMFPIVEAAYHVRGGKDPNLPGSSTVSGDGRADIRFATDAAGELYILSKSDGVIRAIVGFTSEAPARN